VAEGATVQVLRFENEAEDLLHYLKDSGLEPGLEGTVSSSSDDGVVVATSGGATISVTATVAETVSVTADPSPPPRTGLPDLVVMGSTPGERFGR
jgi:DtxR family transcriptional regulator, Mn-dependent transcriptional regulator